MSSLGDVFLKALLNKMPQEALKAVMSEAPQEIKERYEAVQQEKISVLASPQSFFIQPRSLLVGIDPSWYEDIVASCSKSLRRVALQALREEMIGEAKEKKTFSDPVRRFLLQVALSAWPDRNVKKGVRVVFPFFEDCSKELLYSLADLVCLYDIVDDVKKTVEKKKLQKILTRLSLVQQRYLKILIQGTRIASSEPFGMESFLQADVKKAAQIFRTLGLKKLGWILAEEEESTIWRIVHMMDKRDSPLIQEGKDKEEGSYDLEQIKKHVVHALQFLQRK